MEKLVGKLGCIGQTYQPIFHLMPHMYGSVAFGLQNNENFLISISRKFQKMVNRAKAREIPSMDEDKRDINFAIGKVARMTHKCNKEYRIPESFIQEIVYVTRILAGDNIELSTPFVLIVDRDPDFEQGAASCKRSGDGWCIYLPFWRFLDYGPDDVRRA